MHDSKLLNLLKSFEPEDIHWFQKFLKSPFYNRHETPISLFRYISKYYPNLDAPKLSKEKVFKHLYPKEKYSVQKMRKVMYELAVLVEEFLVAMRIRNKDFQKKKLLVAELGERNVYDSFEKGTKMLVRQLEDLPYRDIQTYQEIHQLNLDYYRHTQTLKKKDGLAILKSATQHLDYYYLMQRRQLDFTILWHEKLFGGELLIESLQKSKTALRKTTAFKLYEWILAALQTSDNLAIYVKMEKLFKSKIDELGKNDQKEIIRILINHLSSQINTGKKGYQKKTLSLYQFGLEKKLMMEQGQIGETTFANIATIGILEKEFDWVKGFIQAYEKYLPTSVQEDATKLSLSLLYFHQKDYDKVVELILNHQFLQSLSNLKAKSILLRTYFEQFLLDDSFYDLVIAQTLAFEKYVRRNDLISSSAKTFYLNFILFTRLITNAVLQKSVNQDLLNKINKTESIVLKSWLLEKVTLFLSKKKRHR